MSGAPATYNVHHLCRISQSLSGTKPGKVGQHGQHTYRAHFLGQDPLNLAKSWTLHLTSGSSLSRCQMVVRGYEDNLIWPDSQLIIFALCVYCFVFAFFNFLFSSEFKFAMWGWLLSNLQTLLSHLLLLLWHLILVKSLASFLCTICSLFNQRCWKVHCLIFFIRTIVNWRGSVLIKTVNVSMKRDPLIMCIQTITLYELILIKH